jgi:hypothetical protein
VFALRVPVPFFTGGDVPEELTNEFLAEFGVGNLQEHIAGKVETVTA